MASSVSTSFSEIPQETLDKITMTPEVKEFYSQENEIKRLLIERETYKRAYEEQQKRITDFQEKWDKFLDTSINSSGKTFRNYMNEAKYNYFYDKIYYFKPTNNYILTNKIKKDIFYIKNYFI